MRPPRVARWLLRVTLPRRDRAFVLADLEEEIQEIQLRSGRVRAWAWYWVQALASVPHGLRERWETRHAGPDGVAALTREGWMGRMEMLMRELVYAARGLRRSPGFTATVVATLALGIGANAGLFDLVDRLFLQSPPYLAEPESVHRVYFSTESRGEVRTDGSFGYPAYAALGNSSAFSTLAGQFTTDLPVGDGAARRLEPIGLVTGGYWDLFDAEPALGRFFGEAEDRLPLGQAVAVLSHAYWVTAYGSDPGVLGTTLRVGSRALVVIGVAPRGFAGMLSEPAVAFVPLTAVAPDVVGPGYEGRPFNTWIQLVAQRAPGVPPAAAQSELTSILRGVWMESSGREVTERFKPTIVLAPAQLDRGPMQRASAATSLWLLGTSAFVVVIACLNITILLLARALHRTRDIAMRLASAATRGASRWRPWPSRSCCRSWAAFWACLSHCSSRAERAPCSSRGPRSHRSISNPGSSLSSLCSCP